MNLTDQDIAESFVKWKRKHYPDARPQHLPSYLESHLKGRQWYIDMFPLDRVKLVGRVLLLVRSEGGKTGADTKKKNRKRAALQSQKLRQGVLL